MDILYEESALASHADKQARRWRILNVLSYIALALAIVLAYFTIMFIPIGSTTENGYATAVVMFVFFLSNFLLVAGFWTVLFFWKRRLNISYDYVFVSGELRITKVFHDNKRKLMTRFECEEVMQIGDASTPSCDRLCQDPDVKTIRFTSNDEAAEGKFFMYLLINDGGKKMYILECRETLLMHILRFAKRSALASDYVAQDRKKV